MKPPAEQVEKSYAAVAKSVQSAFGSVVATLVATKNPLAALINGIGSFNAGVQSAAQAGDVYAQSIAGVVGKFAAWLAILIPVAKAIQQVIQFMSQTGEQGKQLAARFDALNIGLATVAKNVGVTVEFAREKVQDLVKTGITSLEAMESVMQFLTQGLPIDNIEKLARAGQDMAVAFGRNSTETFNRFIYAITTGNTEVLRMVGINRTASQMMEAFAKTIGKTAEQLTDLERRQALVDGIMQEASRYTGLYEQSLNSVGKQMTSLTRYVQEGTQAFGQTLLPTLELGVQGATAFWKEFQKLFVVVEDGAVMLDQQGKPKFTEFGQLIFDISATLRDTLLPVIKSLVSSLGDLANNIVVVSKTISPFLELMSRLNSTMDAFGERNTEIEKLEKWGSAVQALLQLFAIAASGFVMVFTTINLMLESGAQKLRGQAGYTFEYIARKAKEAAAEIILAAAGIRAQAGYEERLHLPEVPMSGQGEPPPEDTETIKRQVELGKALADAIEDGQKRVDEAQTRFRESITAFNEEVLKAQIRLSEEYGKAIDAAYEQYREQLANLDKALKDRLAELDEQANEARLEQQENFNERSLDAEEDFLRQMRRMDEDYAIELSDAVQVRDAKQVLQLMRAYAVRKQRAQEDHDLQTEERRQDFTEQQEDLAEREAKARAELQESYNERRKELLQALMERVKDIDEHYREMTKQLIENATKQRDAMTAAYEKQQVDLKKANDDRLKEMVKHWADIGAVDRAGAEKILTGLDAYFGTKGKLIKLVHDFVAEMNKNALIEITIKEGKKPSQEGESGSGTPGSRRAMGGVMTATRPTNIQFGEVPETAIILPHNSNFTLEQFASMFGGKNGGGRTQRLEVSVDVRADNHVSPEFEDALLGKIADIIENQLPDAHVTTGGGFGR